MVVCDVVCPICCAVFGPARVGQTDSRFLVVAKRKTAEWRLRFALRRCCCLSKTTLRLARAQVFKPRQLLFVDARALWCHTCPSMRNFVFTDVQLHPSRIGWSVQRLITEQPSSAAFWRGLRFRTWPTMLAHCTVGIKETRLSRAFSGSAAKEL